MPETTLPVADREVRLPQGTVRYRDAGSGPAIVFLHPLLTSGLTWRRVVALLSPRFRCLVPDLPLGAHAVPLAAEAENTPGTVARMVADFMEALGVDGATLVGNDTGGALAQIVATEHPEHVGKLVLTDCDAFSNFLPPRFRYLQVGARVPGFPFLAAKLLRVRPFRHLPITYGSLAKHGVPSEVLDAFVAALQNPAVQRDVGKFLRGISARYTEEAARKLPGFTKPALVVWAKEDRFFPPEHARRLAKLLPHSRLEMVDDSYTLIQEDQPERLAELISDFAG